MPTQTFFRLPAEKRGRLTEAAWREFTSVPFADASINRIVRAAHIPRGSFYQYFDGKQDLFFLLLGSLREESFALMTAGLAAADGDPFRASLRFFDDVFQSEGHIRPSMVRVMEILRLNQNLDMSQMLLDRLQSDPGLHEIARSVAWDSFRQTDAAFLHEAAALLVSSFALTVRNILCGGATFASERERLCSRLEILRRGSLKEEML